MSNAVELFTVGKAEVTDDLKKVLTLRIGKSGSKTVGLLPATSKTGSSIKSVFPSLRGQAIKAMKRRCQKAMKIAMAKEMVAMAADPAFGGRKMTVSASGIVGFFLQPTDGGETVNPIDAANSLSNEQLLAIIEARAKQIKA